jgi:branched-chain amino acid aminotransferase
MPFDKAFICRAIQLLIEANKVSTGNFKVLIGRQPDRLSTIFLAWLIPYAYPEEKCYRTGVKVSLFEYQRMQPNAKIVRNDFKTKAETQLIETGAYELLLHDGNCVSEGSRSNVFFILDNTLRTAPDNMVLLGITRQKILEIIKDNGLPLIHQAITLKELNSVQAAFLCGTSPKVLPINRIDNKYFFDPEHAISKMISKQYEQMIKKDIDAFSWSSCHNE